MPPKVITPIQGTRNGEQEFRCRTPLPPHPHRRFPSNWELSTARATSIVHYFLTHHRFEPNRLSAAGYGEVRPIAKNHTADGRSQSRRVDIVILSAKEEENEPGVEKKVYPTI